MSRTHGTISCYVAGCRCEDCRAVNTTRGRARCAADRDPSRAREYCPLCDEFFVNVLTHEVKGHA